MSRGLGRCQRAIVEALEHEPFVYLHDLPGSAPAKHRAARRLVDAGLIEVWTHTGIGIGGGNAPRTVAIRKGEPVSVRTQLTLTVDEAIAAGKLSECARVRWRQWL